MIHRYYVTGQTVRERALGIGTVSCCEVLDSESKTNGCKRAFGLFQLLSLEDSEDHI
jgi:hypothetical protein